MTLEGSVAPLTRGMGVTLRPVLSEDVSLLYRWYSDIEFRYLWMYSRYTLSEEEFRAEFIQWMKHYQVFLMVLYQGTSCGFAYTYDENLLDGHLFVAMYLEASHRGQGIGAKAGVLFGDFLFAYFPIHKIYADVFAYNGQVIEALKKGGFVVEGIFRRHRFYRGEYHTMYRLALYRETFYNRFRKWLQKCMKV